MRKAATWSIFFLMACIGIATGSLIGSLVGNLFWAVVWEMIAGAALGLAFYWLDGLFD